MLLTMSIEDLIVVHKWLSGDLIEDNELNIEVTSAIRALYAFVDIQSNSAQNYYLIKFKEDIQDILEQRSEFVA